MPSLPCTVLLLAAVAISPLINISPSIAFSPPPPSTTKTTTTSCMTTPTTITMTRWITNNAKLPQQQQQCHHRSSLLFSTTQSENDLSNFDDDDEDDDLLDDLDLLVQDDVDDLGSSASSTSSSSYGSNVVGGVVVGSGGLPFQTDGGVIMPEGGANPCVIKVLGIGGGGGNAVNRMIQTRIDGVSFWAVNTDAQALAKSLAPNVLNIGRQVTRGLGAGGVPSVGKDSAQENAKEIQQICQGADMVFITAGMGGGTGSGAAPVVAEVSKEAGALTIGIVTKPFRFEGKRRMRQAVGAIERLKQHVDTVIVVSNDRLLDIIPEDTPMNRAFAVADDILRQGVVGISEIIVKPGLINVDFADVRSVMSDAGTALMGIGLGSGKTGAEDAATAAISSPLLDSSIDNAKGVVFNISGGEGLSLTDVNRAARLIYDSVEEDANVIFGALIDESLEDSISITVLATGFADNTKQNIEFLNDVVSGGMMSKDKAKSARGGGGGGASSMSRQQPDDVAYEDDVGEEEPPSDDDDRVPSFLKTLKRKR